MELNREQIIRALECCNTSRPGICKICPYHEFGASCHTKRNADTLALIRDLTESLDRVQRQCGEIIVECDERDATRLMQVAKLTEEKNRIAHECECHRQTVIDNLQRSLEYLNEETERVIADTTRKFAERLKKCFDCDSENIRNTDAYIRDVVDQIAQELLEEAQ